MKNIDIRDIISLSECAAKRILDIYHQVSFAVSLKKDNSFLTQADHDAHTIICEGLKKLYPDIPVISEESSAFHDFEIRKNWPYFFLVDPLDGTKEFVNRNDEFTINIALIRYAEPVLGVVHAPALDVIYYAEQGQGAYKLQENKKTRLPLVCNKNTEVINVAVSRSHSCEKTENFIEKLKNQGKPIRTIAAGSALKFGLVAEGTVDFYPRFMPTMEWDTAAGHVLINEVGKKIVLADQNAGLYYNKPDLRNPGFIVE
ncbi:MAG TPA: 3'(2'),5'-bisphosphate nucleotidase CysQ [Gammaproteobacteria bacterium]|nr:3'(2'),5'-bisphosphate nucleotidase CysQ [Gammaproteobacteria bacterium]